MQIHFLPTRPVVCTDSFILSRPIFLSKNRRLPFLADPTGHLYRFVYPFAPDFLQQKPLAAFFSGPDRSLVPIRLSFRTRFFSARAADRPVAPIFGTESCSFESVPDSLNQAASGSFGLPFLQACEAGKNSRYFPDRMQKRCFL